jgi:hypothetical protein
MTSLAVYLSAVIVSERGGFVNRVRQAIGENEMLKTQN